MGFSEKRTNELKSRLTAMHGCVMPLQLAVAAVVSVVHYFTKEKAPPVPAVPGIPQAQGGRPRRRCRGAAMPESQESHCDLLAWEAAAAAVLVFTIMPSLPGIYKLGDSDVLEFVARHLAVLPKWKSSTAGDAVALLVELLPWGGMPDLTDAVAETVSNAASKGQGGTEAADIPEEWKRRCTCSTIVPAMAACPECTSQPAFAVVQVTNALARFHAFAMSKGAKLKKEQLPVNYMEKHYIHVYVYCLCRFTPVCVEHPCPARTRNARALASHAGCTCASTYGTELRVRRGG